MSHSTARTLAVLGKNWNGRRSGLSIESKMNAIAAGELFVRGQATVIIFSGGRTAGKHRPSEAEAMYAYVRCHFPRELIPDSAVILEEQAIDTAANAEKVAGILRRLRSDEVCILTTRHHLPATQTLFRNYQVRVTGAMAAEEVLSRRSRHYGPFLARWSRSNRARVQLAKELMRRMLLRFDRKGRTLRPITAALRGRGR